MTIEQTRQAASRAAQQARQQQTQRKSQQVANQIRQQAAGISPQVAENLGQALNPHDGFSTRPDGLPQPGQSPGGAGERRVGNIFDGGTAVTQPELLDDHDEVFADVEPNPTRQQSGGIRVKKGAVKPEHPVLSKLREDLGIEALDPVDASVGGHVWTLCALTPGDLATAARLADQLSVGMTERTLVYETAVVAHAVMAIDGHPAWEVFRVEPPNGVPITNPLRPPRAVRYLTAGHLFDFINDQSRTQLADRLYAAYLDKVDAAGEVKSYLDDPLNRKARFRCPQHDCAHELLIVPQYVAGTTDMLVPYCQWHGVEMEMVGEQEDIQSPLT